MEQHYREHVIVYDTSYDYKSKEWTGIAQVRFSEGIKVRIEPVPLSAARFKSKEEAEQGTILAVRQWIDRRLDSSSGPFSKRKKGATAAPPADRKAL
jgi:hypothetical protein